MTNLAADEQFALTTLRDMIANLQAHIDHRAAEIAAPRIAQAHADAFDEVKSAQGMQRRAEDLNVELRRQLRVLQRQRTEYRERAEDAEAALATARENRGPEIHGEPRTRPTPSHDTKPAPLSGTRPAQPRAHSS
ncbi:hypothetical protein ABZ912_19895 [Nonomuraea angiospora]|uniref:hypothetical protein n=1 Tax=Nonomuraea angiospora TaxID=46172 RepID=UPI0033DA2C87